MKKFREYAKLVCMNKKRLTPEARNDIIRRVRAGEKQKVLADTYNVTEGRISQIVSEERNRSSERDRLTGDINLSGETTEQLKNLFVSLHRDIIAQQRERRQNFDECERLEKAILRFTEQATHPPSIKDEVQELQRKLTFYRSDRSSDRGMKKAYLQIAAVCRESEKRGLPLPEISFRFD